MLNYKTKIQCYTDLHICMSSNNVLFISESCPPGNKYNELYSDCVACEHGFYQPNSGAFECNSCGVGRTTIDRGTVDMTGCLGEIYHDTFLSTHCFWFQAISRYLHSLKLSTNSASQELSIYMSTSIV